MIIKVISKILKYWNRLCVWYWREKAMSKIGSFKSKPQINGKVEFTNNTHLGEGANFNGMIIGGGGKVTIGDYFHSGHSCHIMTQNHNYEGTKTPYDATYVTKDVAIGDYVWLGDFVIILPGVTIGEGAIIQAGTVVTSDIPAYAIAGGHPAKVFSQRDKAHFEKLKSEGAFH